MWLLALVILGGIAAGGIVLTIKESQRPGPPLPGSTPADDSKRNKKKLTGENEKLIGLDDPSFRYQTDQGANTGMTTVKFDTTTYGDRAVVQLRNETGSTRTMGDAAILGKPVIQMSGRSGYLWEYSDYDNIDKNGEKFVEVSNRFIISPSQCEDIGDYCWKKLAPHKMYNVTIPGCHPEYEPGDVWTLSGTYVINGITVENINASVEIQSASVHRACLTPGETVLTCVLYDGAWSKTNSTRSRIVGAGKPQWMQNRSNVLVVASKDYPGQADFYCDGVADNVEIQYAIDKLGILGGGRIELTGGVYNLVARININYSNIFLAGYGDSTELLMDLDSDNYILRIYAGCTVKDLSLLGTNDSGANNGYGITISGTTDPVLIENVTVSDITSDSNSVFGISGPLNANINIVNCRIFNLLNNNSLGSAIGIYKADRVYGCTLSDFTATGSAIGIDSSIRCTNNRVDNISGGLTTHKYGTGVTTSYADSGSSYACADTPNGGFNS